MNIVNSELITTANIELNNINNNSKILVVGNLPIIINPKVKANTVYIIPLTVPVPKWLAKE